MTTPAEVLTRPVTQIFSPYRAAVAEYQNEGGFPDFDGFGSAATLRGSAGGERRNGEQRIAVLGRGYESGSG